MIQRIQTVFLLVSAILTALIFFMPLANLITGDGNIFSFNALGVNATLNSVEIKISALPVAILSIMITIINLVAIFLFKKRTFQMRLCVYGMLLLVGLGITAWFYIGVAVEQLQATVRYLVPVIFLPVSLILDFMAYKKISKDDKLVKSLDRIR